MELADRMDFWSSIVSAELKSMERYLNIKVTGE